MPATEWFAIGSALIVLAGAPFYLFDILKGTTKPERTTWFIWSLLSLIAFGSQLKLGARWSLLFVGLDSIGNLVVYLLSLKYGVGGWKLQDKWALAVAGIGLIMSFVLHSPLLALSGVILADIAGFALTIYKAYRLPSSETVITWLFLGLSSGLAAAAVGHWYFQLLLYPVYLSMMCFLVPIAQGFGRLAGHTKPVIDVAGQSPKLPSS